FNKESKYEEGSKVMVSVRPEQFKIVEKERAALEGDITLATFLGDFINYEITLEDGSVVEANEYTEQTNQIRDNKHVYLGFNEETVNVFPVNKEVSGDKDDQ